MIYKGDVLDGAEGTPLHVAEFSGSSNAAKPGGSGSAVMNQNGEFVGVIHGDVPNHSNTDGSESKHDEYERQMGTEINGEACTIAPVVVS